MEFTDEELAIISYALGIMTAGISAELREKHWPVISGIMKKIEALQSEPK